MIVHRRAPRVWVFAVEDGAVQLCWRGLRPGVLDIAVQGRVAPAALALAEPDSAGSDGDGPHRCDAGAATIDGLPAGQLLQIRVTGTSVSSPLELGVRTLASLPGAELTRVATLSDLHIGTQSFGHNGGIVDPEDHDRPHPARCTEAALGEAAAWGAQRIVVKGDLTNAGLPHQWRDYAALVGASPIPVDAMAGNHDCGAYGGLRSLAPSDAASAFDLSLALPMLVRDLPGVRLVMADSTIARHNRGTVAPVLDDIVDAAADAPRDGGVLVLLHHQLQPHRWPEGWPIGVGHDESIQFLDRLGAAHPHALVSSGHTHRNRRWGRAGVVVTQVGSTKDYPGVWAGYRVHEGGIAQTVHRVERTDCVGWTDHSRTAAFGLWEHVSPGRLDARCFNVAWHGAGN